MSNHTLFSQTVAAGRIFAETAERAVHSQTGQPVIKLVNTNLNIDFAVLVTQQISYFRTDCGGRLLKFVDVDGGTWLVDVAEYNLTTDQFAPMGVAGPICL